MSTSEICWSLSTFHFEKPPIIGELIEENTRKVVLASVLKIIETLNDKKEQIDTILVPWNSYIDEEFIPIFRKDIILNARPKTDFIHFYFDQLDILYPKPSDDESMPQVGTKIENGEVVFDSQEDFDNWLILVSAEPPTKIPQ